MAHPRAQLLTLLALAAGAATSASAFAAPDEELLVIVSAQSPVRQVSAAALESYFSGAERRWPEGHNVVVFNLPPEHALRALFDRIVLRLNPDEVGRFWVDQLVRGGARPPRQVPDPVFMVRLVAKLPDSIGYVPAGQLNDSVRVVARLRQGKVVQP